MDKLCILVRIIFFFRMPSTNGFGYRRESSSEIFPIRGIRMFKLALSGIFLGISSQLFIPNKGLGMMKMAIIIVCG